MYKAYPHLQVDEASSFIQAMSTHRGVFRVNRLSFSIKTAPEKFNKIIDQILQDSPKTEKYIDDIIVYGATKEECKNNLIPCLKRLEKYDLHAHFKECKFFQERVDFLGHTVEQNRIFKSPKKIRQLSNYQGHHQLKKCEHF